MFSAFNCRYFKRDFYIFIDKLDNHLNHSVKDLDIYFFILVVFSLISIMASVFNMKLDRIERIYKEKLIKKKGKAEISEKPKKRTLHERFNFDENANTERNNKSFSKRKIKKENIEYKND